MIESTRESDARTTVVLVHPLGDLAPGLTEATIEVPSVLDAVGLVARAAGDPRIGAVVVPGTQLDRFPDAAATLKRLDDGVRIVAVTDEPPAPRSAAALAAATAAEVDVVVAASGGASAVMDALAGHGSTAPRTIAEPVATTSAAAAPAGPHEDAPRPAASTWPFEPAAGRAPGVGPDTSESEAGAGPAAATPPPAPPPPAPPIPAPPPPAPPSPPAVPQDPAELVDEDERRALVGGPPASPARHEPGNAPESPPGADAPDAPPPLSFAEAVRARESRYEAEAEAAEPLGDLDLVEAVLLGGGRLGPVAVRLVREQTGWDDLVFHLEDPDREDASVARAHVVDEGRRFGTLTSRMAAPDELELWAGWLARWLELGRRHELYRTESRTDELTGAANRRAMLEFLERMLHEARARRRPITVMVFDIDDFKRFNDDHGHEAGDVILRETVALLKSVTRRSDLVCRVGGDEFAVVFADLEGPRTAGSAMTEDVGVIARRFQQQVVRMRFPRLGLDAPGTLSISAGLASFPWDGSDPASLLRVADRRALESKRRGKNHITFGPGVPLVEPSESEDDGEPRAGEDPREDAD